MIALPEFEDHSPVYRQIALILRERVGPVWRPGDELPSEGALAEEFGVNRNTLRRAIGVLVEQGILERRRGIKLRVLRIPSLEQPKLEGDPTQLFRMRPRTQFRVLSFDKQRLGAEAAQLLDLPVGREAYRIDRLLLDGEEVAAYLVVYVPLDIGRALRKLDLVNNTITSLLYATLGVRTQRIRQTIEAALADAPVARALGMSPGAAALRCRYVITDEDDRPVQAATYVYRGDRFRLTLDIGTPPPGVATGATRLENWPLAITHRPDSGVKTTRTTPKSKPTRKRKTPG